MRIFDLPSAIGRDLLGIKTEPKSDEEHLEAAIQWLYRSQDVTDCGGSAAYYSLFTGWSGPYPETSGYIIPTLYDYAEYADSDEARQRAEQMARWLLELQFESGAFPEGVDPGPNAGPSVFNTGQILFGLIRAYEETGDETFRQAAEDGADWLVSVQHPDGFWDRYDYLNERHSYCSRVAWALLLVDSISSGTPYRESAKNHLYWVVSRQTENTWFRNSGFEEGDTPFLHTIAYTIRGLLEAGVLLEDNEILSAAVESSEHLRNIQQNNGVLFGAFDANWNHDEFYCPTGNAQMASVWFRLASICQEDKYADAARDSVRFLKKSHTFRSPPTEISGSFSGSVPVWDSYLRFRYPNWATKFFIDAILLSKN